MINVNGSKIKCCYYCDSLGNTRQLTDSLGAVTVSYTYDSFGNLIASSGNGENAYGFTGEQQFGEADNLVYLRHRYYSPSIGRFMSRDPIGTIPDGRKQNWFKPLKRFAHGINLYSYVRNNVINYKDPRGLDSPGCDRIPPFLESLCMPDCCDKHDACYAKHGCTESSWICGGLLDPCTWCNLEVIACVMSCGPELIWTE